MSRLPLTETPTPGYMTWEPHPFALEFPKSWPVDGIHWYGLAYAAGFVAAYLLLRNYHRTGRSPLNDDAQSTLMMAMVAGTIVGGRLGYVFGYMLARNPHALIDDPLFIFKINHGGMASHGGMIGIALATWWCARHFKLRFLRLADIIVTIGPPGVIFGRLANFVNGELWGRVTDAKWAVVFRYPESTHERPLWLEPRHPSQLYAMLLEGVLLTVYTQWRFRRKDPLPAGRLAGEFMIGYALVRIVGEFWREPDEGVSLVLGMSRGQFYSLFLAIAGALVIGFARRKRAAGA